MFLDVLRRRNPAFLEAVIRLHQEGRLPANCYAIDLDAVERNANIIATEGWRLGLKVFAMTKQMGRNPDFCRAVLRGGIDRAVAVDMECGRVCSRAGLPIGHLGHLVQIPRAEAAAGAALAPDYWTVFNDEKAREAADAAAKLGRVQSVLARIQAHGDRFYLGHEGGFDAASILDVADRIDGLNGARFAGITTFPALLFDLEKRAVESTPNLRTLERAAEALRGQGRADIEINAPGTVSAIVLAALASAGATQVEPGHGLTGTTPLHAMEDLPETPAVAYVTEVAHHHGGRAYCFGGGLYIDPVFPEYRPRAIVAAEPTVADAAMMPVDIPPPSAIDYYGMIDPPTGRSVKVGDTVVFGFRPQAFVTRAYVVGVSGVGGEPHLGAVYHSSGVPASWPT